MKRIISMVIPLMQKYNAIMYYVVCYATVDYNNYTIGSIAVAMQHSDQRL